MTNLITLDGVNHFPKEFFDLKAFNSNKAQAIVDKDSDQEEEDANKTAHGDREASIQNRGSAVAFAASNAGQH